MSRKYEFWTTLETRETIIALEQAMTTGAATVSYSGGGTVQWTTRENFDVLLRDLYAAYDRKMGECEKPTIQRVRIVSKRGW